MNKITRYVIKMKNGTYMKTEFDEVVPSQVKVLEVDHPVDADLHRDKETAERIIKEIATTTTFLPVIYNKENPPEEVQEMKIGVEIR
ncbi:hypothetical protein ANABIO32_02490 [Rossellomorea marisflavi]|uniref:hypothetical protein n=1 Tax=Rossellomorea marisflavi TaxID=189381 RepID=UPI0025C9B8FC|nr:hypothetical protein [Rossellomorea marisflavi]GLI82562.1 hypothetical protein ANABIO32_02490 [Rossellomorea marisflavi]